ncbi:hypothetical protein I204_00739 [Kwoniella mangroviensis CBS 8886]|nr:uncharacterized protein I203_05694 [Kwoniella mangroviensis CBS 8507]OCF64952.1 hypothetical protein I203_05694 [Kwoniella mangroviensis CBS 8507]OCF78795.1 hypothetical protein I204_00739 [Kwoniella mangroviensis CBS 8886]
MTKLENQDTSARRQKKESPDPAAHERPDSPPLIDADYSELNHLWIGMYPDFEIGRTGLDLETYRKCIFERVILFDLQPPSQSHSTSQIKEQLLSPKAAPLDPLVTNLSNRILSASSSVVPQTMSSIPSQSDLSTQPSYFTPFTAYPSPAEGSSPPLKSGQTPVESVHPAL